MEDYDRWQALKDSTEHQRKKLVEKNRNLEFYLKKKKLTSDESALLFAEIDSNETKIKDLERTLLECDENLIFWTRRDYRRGSPSTQVRSWTPSSMEEEWENTPRRSHRSDGVDTYSRRRSKQRISQNNDLYDEDLIRVKEETVNALEEKIEKYSSEIIRKRKEVEDLTAESKIIGTELKRKNTELKNVKEEVDKYREAVLREKGRVAKLETKRDELNSQIESLKKSLKENHEPQTKYLDDEKDKDTKEELNVSAYHMTIQRNEKAESHEKRLLEYEKVFAQKEDQIAELMAELEVLRSQNLKSPNGTSQVSIDEIGAKRELEIHGHEMRRLKQKLKTLETDILPDLQKRNSDLIFSVGQLEKENDRLLSVNQDLVSKTEKFERLKISQKWSDKVSKTKKTDQHSRKQSRDTVSVEDFLDSGKDKRQTITGDEIHQSGVSTQQLEQHVGIFNGKSKESTKLEEDQKESLSKAGGDTIISEQKRPSIDGHMTQLRQGTVLDGEDGIGLSLPNGRSINEGDKSPYSVNGAGSRHVKHDTIYKAPIETGDGIYSPRQTLRRGESDEHPVQEEPEIGTGEYEEMFHDRNADTDETQSESGYEHYKDSHHKKKSKFSKTEIKYKKTMQVKDRFKSKSRKLSDSTEFSKKDFDSRKEMDYRIQPEGSLHYERDIDEFFVQKSEGDVTGHALPKSSKESRFKTGKYTAKEVSEEGSSLRHPPLNSQDILGKQDEHQNKIEATEVSEIPNAGHESVENITDIPGDKTSINTGESENDKKVRFHDDTSNVHGTLDETDGVPETRGQTINVLAMDKEELRRTVNELSTENIKLEKELEETKSMLKETEQKLLNAQSELSALKSNLPGVAPTNSQLGFQTAGSGSNIDSDVPEKQKQNFNETEIQIHNEPLHSGPNVGRSATADNFMETEVKSEHLQSAFAPHGMGSSSGDHELALRDLQRELEARDRRIEELEESKRDMKRERDTYKNKYQRYEKKDERKLEDKYDDISDLHKKVSSVERKAHKKEADIYKDNLKLERDLDLAKTKLSEAEKEVKRLKKEAEQSETEKEKELRRLRDTVPNLERERDELSRRLERLERGEFEVSDHSSKMRSVPEKAQSDPDTAAVDKNKKDNIKEEKKESVGLLGKLKGLGRKGEKKETVKEEVKDDSDVHAENKKLKEELAQLNETVPRLEKERDTLKAELDRLQQGNPDADGKGKGNKEDGEHNGPTQGVKGTAIEKKEFSDQSGEKDKLQERIKDLERQLTMEKGAGPDVMAENQKLQEELLQSKSEIDKLKKLNTKTYEEKDYETLPRNGIADGSIQMQRMEKTGTDDAFDLSTKEQLQRDLEEAQQKIKDYEWELQGLRAENDDTANESDRDISRSRKYKKSSKNYAAISRLEKERDALRKELENSNSRLSMLEEQIKDSQHVKDEKLKVDKDRGTIEDDERESKFTDKQKEPTTTSVPKSPASHDVNLQEENKRLKEELTQSNKEIDGLRKTISENEEQIEKLTQEVTDLLADMEKEKTSLHVEDGATTEELKSIQAELEQSKQQIKEYEEQIESLQKERDRAVAEKDRAFVRLKESENNLRLYINRIDSMKKEKARDLANQREELLKQQTGTGTSEKLVQELQEKLDLVSAELEETEKRLKYSEDAMRCHYTRKK